MPNTPSAIKRLKQSTKRRMHNRIAKKIIKTYMKRTLAAVADKEFEKAEADFRAASAKIDQAGARPGLHPKQKRDGAPPRRAPPPTPPARRKSKLARQYKAALSKARAAT